MKVFSNANLWHPRLVHLNRKNLDLLKNMGDNRVSFDGPVPDSKACAVATNTQLVHP